MNFIEGNVTRIISPTMAAGALAPSGPAEVRRGDLEADQAADREDDHAQRIHVRILGVRPGIDTGRKSCPGWAS